MWLSLISLARADWPEDVSLLAMADYAGTSTESTSTDDYVAEGYDALVRELGLSIVNKPTAPAETLGVNGFALTFGTTVSFIRTGVTNASHPTGWDLADPDEDPPLVQLLPWVNVQKGLPASLEVGATFGWLAESRTGFLGVNGRWGLVEGYRQLPDLSIQAGYTGYVGNDELEVGVVDLGATLGYTMPFGVTKGIHQAQFSPFVGAAWNRVHAAPRVDLADTGLLESICTIDEINDEVICDRYHSLLQVNGGFRLVNGDYSATISASYAPGEIATLHAGLGFVY